MASAGVPSIGVFALGNLVAIDRLAQRERLRGGAAFVRRRDHRDRARCPASLDQRAQARRLNSVVVSDQDVRWHQEFAEDWLAKLCRNLSAREKWSGRLDLNQRPHAPQACALPGCATSRLALPLVSVSLAFEKGQDSEQFLVQVEQKFAVRARGKLASVPVRVGVERRAAAESPMVYRALRCVIAATVFGKMFSGARDRESFFVEQALDLENGLDVLAAVEAVARSGSSRAGAWEIRVSQ